MAKKIINCLNHDLLSIYQKTADLEKLTAMLRQYIPSQFHDKVNVSGFSKGTLSIQVNDQRLMSKFRFMLPELRETLRKKENMYNLGTIKLLSDYA